MKVTVRNFSQTGLRDKPIPTVRHESRRHLGLGTTHTHANTHGEAWAALRAEYLLTYLNTHGSRGGAHKHTIVLL